MSRGRGSDVVTIEGLTPEQLLALPREALNALVLSGELLVFRARTAEAATGAGAARLPGQRSAGRRPVLRRGFPQRPNNPLYIRPQLAARPPAARRCPGTAGACGCTASRT